MAEYVEVNSGIWRRCSYCFSQPPGMAGTLNHLVVVVPSCACTVRFAHGPVVACTVPTKEVVLGAVQLVNLQREPATKPSGNSSRGWRTFQQRWTGLRPAV